MLSDRSIKTALERGEISITSEVPIDPIQFQPVSVDLRLGRLMDADDIEALGPRGWERLVSIKPRGFLLGSTLEEIELSPNIVGQVHGKSTRARQGLIVEAAGLIDPGFRGQLTLEIFNMTEWEIELMWGMLICQVTFDFVTTTPDRAYGHPELGSHYQGQTGPTPARR